MHDTELPSQATNIFTVLKLLINCITGDIKKVLRHLLMSELVEVNNYATKRHFLSYNCFFSVQNPISSTKQNKTEQWEQWKTNNFLCSSEISVGIPMENTGKHCNTSYSRDIFYGVGPDLDSNCLPL